MLEVRNLVKKYGDKAAINGLNFRIGPGEIVGLLGLNGAGKSTTMNCITGYIAPTEGSITVDGHDLLKDPDQARSVIGYLPEVFSFYSDMKVREYLDFVCDLKGFSRDRKLRKEHIETVCRQAGIWERSGRMIRNLSKGYRQRVGFAQALIGNPKVLILDEPTVGLDPSQIIEIRQLIREAGRESTVIVSSHILSEIQAICSRIIVIHGGRIVADGSPAELLAEGGNQRKITICVKGSRNRIEEVLHNMEGISSFVHISSPEEGAEEYSLKEDPSKVSRKMDAAVFEQTKDPSVLDIREVIFRAFSSADLPILQLSSEENSLEQLFLHLTGQDPASSEDPTSVTAEGSNVTASEAGKGGESDGSDL